MNGTSAERMIQSTLQRVLGFDRYLYVFSRYKIATLRRDPDEGDVIHFAKMLPTDAVVLDIGANIGIMTVHLARRVVDGHVHAFEPVPENFAALGRIVAHYKLSNVTLHHLALGEEDGELTMVMPVESSVRMQGLSRVVTGGTGDPTSGEKYTVPQRRLDDLESLAEVDVAGIKIDVEDFEQYVFRGAAQADRTMSADHLRGAGRRRQPACVRGVLRRAPLRPGCASRRPDRALRRGHPRQAQLLPPAARPSGPRADLIASAVGYGESTARSRVVQSAERLTLDQEVAGSIPAPRA